MTERTISRFLSGHCRIHPLSNRLLLPLSKMKYPNMPVDVAHGPRVIKCNSTLKSYSILSRLWHRSVWLSSNPLMHLCPLVTWVLPAWRTHPTVLSQLSQMKRDWRQHPPSLPLHLSPITIYPFLSLCVSHDGTQILGVEADRQIFVVLSSPSRLPHSPVTVWRPYWTPLSLSPDWSFLTPTHALPAQSRITTIVRLLRAAWHQLGPVSTHTLGLLSTSSMT